MSPESPLKDMRDLSLSTDLWREFEQQVATDSLLARSDRIRCRQEGAQHIVSATPIGFELLMEKMAEAANHCQNPELEVEFARVFKEIVALLTSLSEDEYYAEEDPAPL